MTTPAPATGPTLSRETGIARLIALGLVPLAPACALLAGGPAVAVTLLALVLAGIAIAARRIGGEAEKMLLSLALVGNCAGVTAAMAGHAWQIDTHMLFFAILAIVSTMGSIAALLVATAVTAIHHLTLGLLVPALVYPATGQIDSVARTAIHAAIVLFEVGVLAWSMRARQRADADLRDSRGRLAETADRAAAAQAEAELARERADAAAERTRAEGRRAERAVQQIAAAARSAAESTAHAKTVMSRAAEEARQSGTLVGRTRTAMTAIEESAHQITRIVGLIDEIARQTDLLALNAAVESARAGEAGRGFSVVANEVRKLAQRSADAAQQIRSLVSTSTLRVGEGAQLVDDTGGALERIVRNVADLDMLMADLAAMAAEQSAGLSQVTVAIRQIDTLAQSDDAPRDDAPARLPVAA
ncbi:MAG: hypothetical protein RIR62_1706 [Pseudomonadota bacterium]